MDVRTPERKNPWIYERLNVKKPRMWEHLCVPISLQLYLLEGSNWQNVSRMLRVLEVLKCWLAGDFFSVAASQRTFAVSPLNSVALKEKKPSGTKGRQNVQ